MFLNKKKEFILIGFILIILHVQISIAQDQVKEGIFREAQVLLEDAKNVESSLYSPTFFEKGLELYTKAEKEFEEGKKLDNIRKKLQEASVQFKKSIETTRMSKLTLAELTKSRNDALEQQSLEWEPNLFQEAEKDFRRAAEKVENGNTNEAKKYVLRGGQIYRRAELLAIKNRILNDVRTSLKSCEEQEVEKYAPLTLEQAKTFNANAVAILDQDRYDQDRAITEAEKGAYEARHALFLTSVIKDLQEKKDGNEIYLLDVENQFKRISESLNLDLEFDGGFQVPAFKMIEAISILLDKTQNQQIKIEELATAINQLSVELDNLKSGQLKELTGKLTEFEKELEAARKIKERFENVRRNFLPDEAKVIQESENIIIRLYGVNFPSGKSIIHPDYFPLLSKVIKSIEEFPDAHIIIEGHTDSRGSNAVNQKLATDRANSVMQYIKANLSIDQLNISRMGYGEDRPIASNDTVEGRSLNRRIDVVIITNN